MQTVSWIALSEDAFWFVWDTEVNERRQFIASWILCPF